MTAPAYAVLDHGRWRLSHGLAADGPLADWDLDNLVMACASAHLCLANPVRAHAVPGSCSNSCGAPGGRSFYRFTA